MDLLVLLSETVMLIRGFNRGLLGYDTEEPAARYLEDGGSMFL
jgi:hypothetical protein